jgi:16S rRNA (adenine1518-N6/adenine1519-N6)-dimethyltransferase
VARSAQTLNKHLGHVAKKRFGQHFLSDRSTVAAIVDLIAPKPEQRFIEIGPGLGAITFPLLNYLSQMTVIELDRDLAQKLRSIAKLTVVQADVLTVDVTLIAPVGSGGIRVVGNLPYNISTPILFHLLQYRAQVHDQHFMLQKEVVDRMVAPPDSAAFGRLSVMLQAHYAMESILAIGPSSFTPPPRVQSAIVRMVPIDASASYPDQTGFSHLEELVRVAFSQRRKLLRHSLGRWLTEKAYAGQFDLQRRAQEVSVAEYLELARQTCVRPPLTSSPR